LRTKLLLIFADDTDKEEVSPDSTWSFQKFIWDGDEVTAGGYKRFLSEGAESV
jgi:hypothetical protein